MPENISYIANALDIAKKLNRPFSGSHRSEIEALQLKMKLKFPNAFEEYLLCFGGEDEEENPDSLFVGLDTSMWFIEFNTEALLETLDEENIPLPEKMPLICFYSSQGCVRYWFHTNGDENPICYMYWETADSSFVDKIGRFDFTLEKIISSLGN